MKQCHQAQLGACLGDQLERDDNDWITTTNFGELIAMIRQKMFTKRLLALSVLAQFLVPVMTVSSMAQPAPNRVATHIYQWGPMTVVPRGAVNRKNWVNKKNRPVQSIPSETRRGCRWLYSGGPKSPVPPTC